MVCGLEWWNGIYTLWDGMDGGCGDGGGNGC